MFSSIDQLTTVISGAPMSFLPQNDIAAANLYFHLVLRFDGAPLTAGQEAQLKKYIASFIGRKGGNLTALTVAKNRVHLLAGLSPFCAPGTFIREFKLLSASFAQRRLGARNFVWQEKHDAFTVSLSQIERVCSYIRRQKMLDRQESYGASWNRLTSQELY